MRVLNLFQDLLVSWLEVFMGVGTKDKRLVRTDNSSSANMGSERMCIVFFLYWELYVLMELAVNFRNEDLVGKALLLMLVCICVLMGV